MNKKDYHAIASAIYYAIDSVDVRKVNLDELLTSLCIYMQADNQNFKPEQFKNAARWDNQR